MIRRVVEYHPNPRRADGRLWCGHPESAATVDGGGVVVCGECPGSAKGAVDARPDAQNPGAVKSVEGVK